MPEGKKHREMVLENTKIFLTKKIYEKATLIWQSIHPVAGRVLHILIPQGT